MSACECRIFVCASVYIIFLFFFTNFVLAQSQSSSLGTVYLTPGQNKDSSVVIFKLEDNKGVAIKDAHINMYLKDRKSNLEFHTLYYLNNEFIITEIANGEWIITMTADNIETEGKDYFFQDVLIVEQDTNETVSMLPVGTIRGMVSYNGEVVHGAELKFECISSYGNLPVQTDSYGSFSADLPVGICKISAQYENKIGFYEVKVTHGCLENIEIELSKNRAGSQYYSLILAFVLVVIIIFIFIYISKIKKSKPKKSDETETNKIGEKLANKKRVNDIFQTLSDKEKAVVDFLMNHGKSYQNKIVYGANIPKTSLVRVLKQLEQKKIVTVEKIGKTKKVDLSDWFLEKE